MKHALTLESDEMAIVMALSILGVVAMEGEPAPELERECQILASNVCELMQGIGHSRKLNLILLLRETLKKCAEWEQNTERAY